MDSGRQGRVVAGPGGCRNGCRRTGGQGYDLHRGRQPVSEDQVRQKLQSDGWSNVRIVRDGWYFEAMVSKDGQTAKVAVNSRTGRLRADDDDDED